MCLSFDISQKPLRLVTDSHIRTFALVANEGCGPPAVVVVAIEEGLVRNSSFGRSLGVFRVFRVCRV